MPEKPYDVMFETLRVPRSVVFDVMGCSFFILGLAADGPRPLLPVANKLKNMVDKNGAKVSISPEYGLWKSL